MSHNDPKEIVLDPGTENELRKLAKRAVNPKVRLSYFERQQVEQLGMMKSVDVHGNLDLNEQANVMSQAPASRRVSPNVRVSGTYTGPNASPAERTMNEKAKCAQFCKSQGRSHCPNCHGEGFVQKTARESGMNKNHSRHNL